MNDTGKFSVGQQFMTRGKAPKLCTIVDVWRTYNAIGELVRLRYVATHTTAGLTVTDHDVTETAVAMGIQPSPVVVSAYPTEAF